MGDWIEIVLRSLLILAGLFVITKLLGKKQLSKLSYFEYIVGIIIGDIAGSLSMDAEANLVNGVTSILIWTLISILLSYVSLKNKKVRDIVEGKARVFIKDGKILEGNLRKERFTSDELLEMLRKKSVFSVREVEFALLEADGELSVLLKRDYRAVKPSELWLQLPEDKEPRTVIMDGQIIEEMVEEVGRNKGWLQDMLADKHVNVEDVYLAQLHSDGKLSLDYYHDKIEQEE
ncbi:DUF421 domain-containing protein [Guptibacillus hwajinpoensis]|uniref:Uncharacterized membrane protein YcaP (DUF421 family) n=1 Tax=Guptibacillus hwajinpoensis TaxID=208199 RepID=A0ABU0K2I9_9BACL|nr:DUF421 domain-containing protein [Alkalihalobacillus hemicentroti]MDQ0483583.1 uncharacterized membrane protein YcaP (DUF421 family) [Alkalihalobacillus hemicentroti]